jgi:hypothetical protein
MATTARLSVGGLDRFYDVNVIAQNDARLIDHLAIHVVEMNDDGFVTSDKAYPANNRSTWPPALQASVTSITFAPIFTSLTQGLHGVTVATADGLVQTGPWPIAVRSLIVDVLIAVGLPNPLRRTMCVHVHQNVSTLTVTPATLAIPNGARVRASVLALFGDGRTGDVSLDPGMRWQVTGPFELVTNDDPSAPSPAGQWVRATAATGTGELTLMPPAHLTPTDASHSVLKIALRATAAWDQPREATFLKEFSAGLDKIDSVPNIIFLPEGYTDPDPSNPSQDTGAQRGQFETLITTAIAEIAGNKTYDPFSTLIRSRSFNFFRLWMPSKDHGVNIGAPLIRNPKHPKRDLGQLAVATARPKSPTAPVASVENLLFQVGWPTPADLARDFTAQRTEWQRLYGQSHTNGVTATIHKDWLALANRSFALEVDTAFGLQHGSRPQCDYAAPTLMRWNAFRTSRADVDRMLSKLFAKKSDGTTVDLGAVWTVASDRDRVYFLAASPLHGGTRQLPPKEGTIASLTTNQACESTPAGATGIIKLVVPPAPSNGSAISFLSTFTHELAHTFHCGDEYGGNPGPPPNVPKFANSGWNVQLDVALRQGTILVPERIRWRWPRIAGAGVLAAKPNAPADPPNAPITIVVRPDHGVFIADALKQQPQPLVRLRPRPLMMLNGDGALVTPPFSTLLRVTGRQGDQFTVVKEDPAAEFHFDDYPTGSLMFVPKIVDGVQQTLVQTAIATVISNTQQPLDRSADIGCLPNDQPRVPFNLLSPNRLYHGSRPRALIGIYDGGAFFYCGIYHAAGDCMMRAMRPDVREPETTIAGGDRVTAPSGLVGAPFCHACRYIIVDQVNPLAHGSMENAFEVLK